MQQAPTTPAPPPCPHPLPPPSAPTLMPRCFMRCCRRSLSSGKGMMGRATREVSSRNTLVLEKGMAYRKVGSLHLRRRQSARAQRQWRHGTHKKMHSRQNKQHNRQLRLKTPAARPRPALVNRHEQQHTMPRPAPPRHAHSALRCLMSGVASRWSSLQSMNSMVPRSKGWLSTSTTMPYAPW